jgi:hypothetical protein
MITSFVNAAMSCRSFCVQSVNLNFYYTLERRIWQ